jgi:hypothetical protein
VPPCLAFSARAIQAADDVSFRFGHQKNGVCAFGMVSQNLSFLLDRVIELARFKRQSGIAFDFVQVGDELLRVIGVASRMA